jgi:hypothetical protein
MFKKNNPYLGILIKFSALYVLGIICLDVFSLWLSNAKGTFEKQHMNGILPYLVLGTFSIYMAVSRTLAIDTPAEFKRPSIMKIGILMGLGSGLVLGLYNVLKITIFLEGNDTQEIEKEVMKAMSEIQSKYDDHELWEIQQMSLILARALVSSPVIFSINVVLNTLNGLIVSFFIRLIFKIKK